MALSAQQPPNDGEDDSSVVLRSHHQQQHDDLKNKTASHVYILDPQHSWIPCQVVKRQLATAKKKSTFATPGGTSSWNNNNQNKKNQANVVAAANAAATTEAAVEEEEWEIVVRVPQYASEQAIQCDGGRTAKRFQEQTILLNDPKVKPYYPNQTLPLQNVDGEGRLQVVEDMVDLSFLHEAAILYNLKSRHVKSLPYTRTGDIVIAVNPYHWITDLYSPKIRQSYAQALVWNSWADNHQEDPRKHLKPHVYEASSLAYKGLLQQGLDQSILVSGESGAGKTETVKILLGDLAQVQKGQGDARQVDESILQKVLDSNPLLEAFGNAQTIRNDNSSRFGKYLQLQFHSQTSTGQKCVLAGSKCEVYLLEKSRVTLHGEEERTYHIFYQLLAAPEEIKAQIWNGLVETDVESFDYVGWTSTNMIEGKTDAERFQMTVQALELIGVSGETLQMLWRTICIVLQLGNLEFSHAPLGEGKDNPFAGMITTSYSGESNSFDNNDLVEMNEDASCISSPEELEALSEIMGIDAATLTKALTIRNVQARNEVFPVPLTAERAKESCDAFAKEIYAKTFLWLVRTINDATCAEKNYHPAGNNSQNREYGIIGLLDIFGFETFEVNRFEQLCINYANEKLQQKFTQDIFRSVQIEYEMEGIELEEITYDDNTDVLDLVEGRMGLLAFLNEECVRPKGSDKTFVYKADNMNKDNPCFVRDLHAPDTEFGIIHYAGKVIYDATNFVVKNTDTLPSDLQDCATLSTNEIVAKHLTNEDVMNPLHGRNPNLNAKKSRRNQTKARPTHLLKKRTSNIVAETVWSKFKGQLCRLMEALSETQTRYIRCIKPNDQKKPLLMQHASTVQQLRCAGVVAAVTISRSAFPNRLEHVVVLERFRTLWPKGDHNSILQDMTIPLDERMYKAVEVLLTIALKDMEVERSNTNNTQTTVFRGFVMGKTRAYFRGGALEFLEGERLKFLGKYATMMQAQVRGCLMRSKYHRHRRAVIRLQAGHRRRVLQSAYQLQRQSSVRIQCWYRVMNASRAIVHLRRMVKARMIQTQWRIRRDSRAFHKIRNATIVIQTMVRGALQRPKYRQALKEKKEETKLENQLRTLQRKLEEAEAKRVEAEKEAEEKANAAIAHYKKIEEQKAKEEEEARLKKQEEQERLAKEAEEEAKQEQEQARLQRLDPEMHQTGEDPSVTSPRALQFEEEMKRREEEDERKRIADEEAKRQMEEERQRLEREHQEELQHITEEQQKLMDESGKMLEHLRKEVFKLRSQNHQLKTDFDLLKDNNQRLMDANASAGASFAALNQHAKQLSKQNTSLVNDVSSLKTQIGKLNILQVELKDELRMKQASYVAEVQSRLQYQKALQKMADLIQDNCRDHRLVEKVLGVADECEMEYMSADHHNPNNSHSQQRHAHSGVLTSASSDEDPAVPLGNESRSSIFSYLNPFSS